MFRKYLLIYSDIKKHGSLHGWVFLKAHLTPKLFWISLLPSSCGFRSPVGQPSSAAPVCLQTSAGQPRATASPSRSYHPGEKKKCEHTAVETHTHTVSSIKLCYILHQSAAFIVQAYQTGANLEQSRILKMTHLHSTLNSFSWHYP